MESREFLVLRNGRAVMDEDLSEKLGYIKQVHPESYSDDSSGYEWNEIGMANLFGELYNTEARYCPEHKLWYVYDGSKWAKDEGNIRISEKVKDFFRLMNLYCGEILDDDVRKSYSQFINRVGDRRMRDRILKDAEGELVISATLFDSNPYLINCENGTYDLQHGTFTEPDWRQYITMSTAFPHTIDHNIRCERWERFIREVTQNNTEKAGYIQKALGYSILGKSNEACMFILYGKTTRNGKSTMLSAIQTMLGDYAKVSPVGLICRGKYQKDADAASPELVMLKGRRFVTMSESAEYGKLDEEKIKQFTGGEKLTGRGLWQSPISFDPQFTMWLSCNDLPEVSDRSLFASERIRVIEFDKHFSEEEQDKTLGEYFQTTEARQGIFNWLIEGYRKYLAEGLKMPTTIRQAVDAYEKDNDIVGQFCDERCEKNPDERVKGKDLYVSFKNWCRGNGYDAEAFGGIRKFHNEMARHPDYYTAIIEVARCKYYSGMKMKI